MASFEDLRQTIDSILLNGPMNFSDSNSKTKNKDAIEAKLRGIERLGGSSLASTTVSERISLQQDTPEGQLPNFAEDVIEVSFDEDNAEEELDEMLDAVV